MRSGRSLMAAAIAAMLLLGAEPAAAQLRVGPEVNLDDAGSGGAPVLSYDTQRGSWVAFWHGGSGRLISRFISPDLRPKHDADTQFVGDLPVTAAYDPSADEHVLTSFADSTSHVWRFSPTGALTGGAWTLQSGAVLPVVGLDPRTGAGIVVYVVDYFPDESVGGVWVQRLAVGGGPQGTPVRVSDPGARIDLYRPAVAFHPARGEFAVVWREHHTLSNTLVGDVMARRVSASGDPLGGPIAVSDTRSAITTQLPPDTPEGVGVPALAYEPATAGYVVAWSAARGDVLESPTQVYGQRLDADLNQVGPDDFRISAGPGNVMPQSRPVLAANDGIVVAWRRWVDEQLQ